MKILLAHNYYQQAGGEDFVVSNERALLQGAGHEVQFYTVSNDAISGFVKKLNTFIETPYSAGAKRDFAASIAAFKPDIVHVHNFFPLLTPSIYDACIEAEVPVVQTLHNYRTICSSALLMRDGAVCEKCLGTSPWWGVWHRCYRNSLPGSLALARMIAFHRKRNTWHNKVSLFISLSNFARDKFIEGGFPAEPIIVKPNFVVDPGNQAHNKREGALFVGRISMEKGVDVLVNAWRGISYPLRIAGGGPLFENIRAGAPKTLEFLGQVSGAEVYAQMEQASFLVMPSTWYETFGLVIVEGFANALPALVSRLGSMAEIVEDGVTGLHFTAGDADDLAAKVRWAIEHPKEMRQMGCNARAEYECKYTPETNYKQLMAIYEAAMQGREAL